MKTKTTWRSAAVGAVLSLVAVGLAPNAAVAEEGDPERNVASVSNGGEVVQYTTLAAAVDNAPDGATITLLEDVTLDSIVEFDESRNLTLDLADKTVTAADKAYLVAEDTNLTITGPGTLDVVTPYQDYPLRIRGGIDPAETEHTVVNITGGVHIAGAPGVFVAATVTEGDHSNNGIVVNIEDAHFTAYDYAVYVNGTISVYNTEVLPVINISDSTIIADGTDDSHGMYLAGAAKTTINNTYIDTAAGGGTGIELRAGDLTLNDVTVVSGSGGYQATANGNGSTAQNAAIAVMQHVDTVDGPRPISLTINGGEFQGSAALALANPQGNSGYPAGINASVEGGLFAGDIVSDASVGDAVTGFINGGEFGVDVAALGFINPASALLVSAGEKVTGGYTVMSPEQARELAHASVTSANGVTVYYEDAEEARAAAGESEDINVIHTVTFDYAGAGATTVVKVDEGATIAKPAEPTRAGYRFTGWAVGGTAYDFSAPVTASFTLVARWQADKPAPADPKPTPKPTPKPVNLVDVSSNKNSKNYTQFHHQIQWLANEGITRGWNVGGGKHEFRPKQEITREAMAAFMYRYAGSPKVTLPAKSPFSDVTPQNTNFYKEIVWMNQQGISTGWHMAGGKKEFRPKDNITRDAMAAFMYRFAGKPATTVPATSPFADVTPQTQFYKEIAWLSNAKISTGWTQSKGKPQYRPYEEISREAMAAFLYRLDRI